MANDLNRSIKIYLDNSSAMTSADELQKRIGELESKLIDLQTAGKGNSDQAKKIEKELTAQTKKYENYKREVADTERVLKNLSGATYNELLRAKKDVDKQLRSSIRNTDLYNKRLEVQKSISRELLVAQKEMRLEVASQASVFSRANDFIGKYMGLIGTGIAAITGITMAFSKFRDERDKLEASSANLKALTGLDDENVKQLESAAKRLSTTITEEGVRIRQSAVEIDDSFAIIGSQRPELLKNAEALEKVTQDAIYLSIAGKDKLEPAAKALTTVMNQMNLGAENSRRIINAIAAGSQAGAGNIQYITDAFEKSGTTARLMNIELEQHIGLIEAVAPKYSEASIAGNSLDKVLLKMKEKGIGYKNGVFDLSQAIGELETKFKNGESAATLFGAEHAKMAEILVMNKAEIESYTAAVTGTNKAVEQAQINSDTNEAKRAQARNKMNLLAIDLMDKLNPAIIGAMNQTVHWTGKLVTLATWISENATEILAVVIGLSAYTVAVKSAIIVDKLQVLWNEKIISSLKTMYATMLKNPYALMGAVVLTWLLYMRKANQELTKMEVVQKRLNKVETEAAQNIAEQKTELEQFLRVARDESESKERRLSALKKINAISPEYLGNLTLEEINTDKATTAINRYIDSIYAMAKAQAAKEQLLEIEKEKIRLDADPEAFQEQIPWWEEMEVGLFGMFSKDKADKMLADMVTRGRARRDKTKEALDAQAEALRSIITDSSKTVNDILSGDNPKGNGSDGDPKKVQDEKLKEVDRYVRQEQLKLKESYLQGLMDKAEYNKKLEMLELEALNRRMAIYGLDKDKQAEIQDKILSYKVKILEQTRKFEESQEKYRQKAEKKEEEAKQKALNSELKRIVAKNNEKQAKEYEEQKKHQERLKELASGFSTEIGTILGGAIAGNNDLVKSSLVAIINMGLDALELTAQMAAAEAVIKGGGQGGLIGLAKGAVVAGLIKAAFSAVKALVGNMVNNIGSNDTSSPVSVNGTTSNTGSRVVTDGFYVGGFTGHGSPYAVSGPTHFEEYVVPSFVMSEPAAMNHVAALEAMRRQKTNANPLPGSVNGFANGGYTGNPPTSNNGNDNSEMLLSVMKRLIVLLGNLEGGIKAYVVYSDLERKRQTLEKTRRLGGK